MKPRTYAYGLSKLQRREYVGRSAPVWHRSVLATGLRNNAEFEHDVG